MGILKKIGQFFSGSFDATKALMLAVAAFFAHYLWIRRRKEKVERDNAHLKDRVELMKVEKAIEDEKEKIDEKASKHSARDGIDEFLRDGGDDF
jgi:hypothetical protein